MSKAPTVIHQYGRPVKAKLPNGDIIERQDKIYVPSYHAVFPCLDYDSHFVYYYGKTLGTTMFCTCGSGSGIFGYRAYKKYCSYIGENVIGCIHHLQYGKHADGST